MIKYSRSESSILMKTRFVTSEIPFAIFRNTGLFGKSRDDEGALIFL